MAREPFAARLTSIWIGGTFYWAVRGFKGSLTDQLIDKFLGDSIPETKGVMQN